MRDDIVNLRPLRSCNPCSKNNTAKGGFSPQATSAPLGAALLPHGFSWGADLVPLCTQAPTRGHLLTIGPWFAYGLSRGTVDIKVHDALEEPVYTNSATGKHLIQQIVGGAML